MRIAALMSIASPWSRDAAVRLSKCGHQVHVIGFEKGAADAYLTASDKFQSEDLRVFRRTVTAVHSLGVDHPSSPVHFMRARKLRAILRDVDAGVLLTLYGGAFAMLAYLSGFQPYAVYVVGTDVLFGGLLKRMVSRHVLTCASTVFSNGAHLARKTRELAPGAQVRELYLGTDTEKFSIGCPPAQPVTVVCPRGFNEVYNNELIIRALALLPPELDGFTIVFAAGGPLLDKARCQADRLLVPSRRQCVDFLGGIGRDDFANLLKRSHVYVSVSKSDGTSLSLMEAMACGLFPVLSDIPQNREWVSEQAGNGILVPVNDSKALAEGLLRAISDPELRAKATLYNRRLILERADNRKNMSILASQLEVLASMCRSARHRCGVHWPAIRERRGGT